MARAIPLNVNLFQIKLFLSIAETRNFSRTAELMHMEQSTLSRRIAVLEQELGFPLFKRNSRPVQLTEEGQQLLNRWSAMLNDYEQSLTQVYAKRARSQASLTVCIIDSGNQLASIPGLGQAAHEAMPGVVVSFQVASAEQFEARLRNRLADLVVTSEALTYQLDAAFAVHKVKQVPLLACVLATNPLSRKQELTWDDLQTQRFLAISHPAMSYQEQLVRALCNQHGFDPAFGSESLSAHGLSSALQNDDEVLICDQFLRGIESPLIKQFELPGESSSLCAVYTRENRNPHIDAFIRVMTEFYGT